MNSTSQLNWPDLSVEHRRTLTLAHDATLGLLVIASLLSLFALSVWRSNNSGADVANAENLGDLAGRSCLIAVLVVVLSGLSLAARRRTPISAVLIAGLAWAAVSLNTTLWTDFDGPPPTPLLVGLLVASVGGTALQTRATWILVKRTPRRTSTRT